MSSKIGVQNIAHTNGTNAMTIASDGSVSMTGHVLQVKYFQLTTSQIETYGTTNTDQAITNFVVNITPKSASSIIKIEANMMFEWGNSPWDTMWFFYRDTTKLGNTQASAGSRRIGIAPSLPSHGNVTMNSDSTAEYATLTYFDDPQTTSSIDYKLGVNSLGTNSIFINRMIADNIDSSSYERGVSFISATEIGG